MDEKEQKKKAHTEVHSWVRLSSHQSLQQVVIENTRYE